VVVALVIAIAVSRRSTTLVDDSLLGGAFLCYVTWALAGWEWLIPPAILFLGYAWFSPPNVDDGQRFHGVAAVLAVWVAALVWLTLSRTRGDAALVYPFTLVFACHMAIFGLSRLAHADRRRTLPALTTIAVVRAWLLLFLPFLMVQGLNGSSLALSLWAGACIYAAAALFIRTEPDIRNTSLTPSRWIRQAASGGLGSAAGWLVLVALERM
jgi:phytol kinase